MSTMPPPPGAPAPMDPRSAKADAKAAKARSKALRPWWKKKRFILGGLVALVVVASAAGAGNSDDEPTDNAGAAESESKSDKRSISQGLGSADASDDVELTACGPDEFGWGNAEVAITNTSSKRSDYFVTVAFESADGNEKFADAIAHSMNVEPGQRSTVEANSLTEVPGGATCRIVEVQRTASV